MTAGIVGLGLIGGSLAKAYKAAGHKVLAFDIDETMLGYAKISGVVDEILTDENLKECDVVLIALTPKCAMEYLTKANFPKGQLVIDCCGTKKEICDLGFKLAEEKGFVFIGGHPMAGKQFSGFKNSKAELFKGAIMALVPPRYDDIELFDRAKAALSPAGFGRYTIWSAENHDHIIAFTSQLAHIVSNAYMKSPTAKEHKGLSAGSYKDLTRVAYLNAPMWTELFMENRENVLFELDTIISSLSSYRDAIRKGDEETLAALLEEGSRLKEEVDRVEKGKS